MNKTLAIIGLLILIIAGGFILYSKNHLMSTTNTDALPQYSTEPANNTSADTSTDFTTPLPQTVTVTYTNTGFTPSTVTLNKGDTIEFKNTGTQNMWVASNPHPTHTDYPGFDALKGYAPETSYSFTFNESGTWGYHDHLHPLLGGTVIVVAGDK